LKGVIVLGIIISTVMPITTLSKELVVWLCIAVAIVLTGLVYWVLEVSHTTLNNVVVVAHLNVQRNMERFHSHLSFAHLLHLSLPPASFGTRTQMSESWMESQRLPSFTPPLPLPVITNSDPIPTRPASWALALPFGR
jgi:hypothetical protein